MKNIIRGISLIMPIIGMALSVENSFEPMIGLQLGYPNIAELHGGIYYTSNNIGGIPSGPLAMASIGDAYSMLGIGFGGYEAGHSYCRGYRIEINGGYNYADRMGVDRNQWLIGSKISVTPGFFGIDFGIIKGVKDDNGAIQFGIHLFM